MVMKDNIASLTKNDILGIIKACSKNNVESLEIDGLKIEFKKEPTNQTASWPEATPSKVKKDIAETPTDPRLDQELDMLMITDPEAYEQAVNDGAMNGEATKDF